MKFNQLTKIFALSLLLLVTACKKYGYEVPDGYPDDSGNVADGVLDTNMRVIDKSMYSKARVFPGLVDQAEPRVQNAQFTLNLNFTAQTAEVLRISVAPKPQLSTGYYAAPGELVKIVVPAGIDGLSVQVGVHTDNLSGLSPLLRDPVIYTRKQLYSGVNFVRNLYGGYIYILADRAYRSSETSTDPYLVTFTISNACVAPDFILGESNDADWMAKVKSSLVPWLELRCKRVIFTVPRDLLVAKFTSARDPLTKPSELMQEWNNIFEQHYNAWMGLSDDAEDLIDRSPQGPWRGTVDIQISGFPSAAGHSGFPFMGLYNYNDSEWFQTWVSLNQLRTNQPKPNWGTYHEFGHNCQQNTTWNWSALGEVTNNLFSYKVAKFYGQDFKILHPPNNWNADGLAFAASSGVKVFETGLNSSDGEGAFARTVPFVQLMEKFNPDGKYKIITDLYVKARHAPRLSNSDQIKRDFFYESVCESAKTDLIPFFMAWGIQVSTVSQKAIANKYPVLKDPIWTYDILNKTGGTGIANYPVPLTFVSVSSVQTSDGATAAGTNLVDGKPDTFWHSQYSPAPNASQTYPFTIVISTPVATRVVPFRGVTLTQRASATNGRVKDIEVLVSDDNVSYTSAGTLTVPNDVAPYNYVFPSGAKSGRFVKFLIKNGYTANAFASVAEVGLLF